MVLQITINEDQSIRVKALSKSKFDKTYKTKEDLWNDISDYKAPHYGWFLKQRVFSYIFEFHPSTPQHIRDYYHNHFSIRKTQP